MAENLFGKIDSRGSTPVTYNFTPLSTAEAFSTSKSYAVGDYCFYGGDLYKCIASKSAGAWSPTEFEEANLGNDVANLKEDIDDLGFSVVNGKLCVTYTE